MENSIKHNRMKIQKKIARLAALLVIIFLLTLGAMLYLYPPHERIPLSNGGDINKDVNLSEIIAAKFSFRSILADALQVPLQLRWYDIHVANTSIPYDQNCVKYGTGQPILGMYFSDASIPNRYASSSNFISYSDYVAMPSDGMGKMFPVINDKGYLIEQGKTATFVYKADDPLHFRIQGGGSDREIINREGKCAQVIADMASVMQNIAKDHEFGFEMYATPNLLAWWTKFFILFLILISLGALILSLSDWASGKQK